ncbi:MAG: hypothetical protein PVH79_03275 [Candidatus Bathyarchaeota archaeon]
MVFCIFLVTIVLVFGDLIQAGNYAGGMGMVKIIFFLAMIAVCAFILWKFRD